MAYFVINKLLGYRMSIVSENIKNSFPEMKAEDRRQIIIDFYRYLSLLMMETIWLFGITENRVRKRFKVENPQVLDKFERDGKDLILILPHYSCWELVLSSLNLFVNHQVETIFVPLSNPSFDKHYLKMRTKLGAKMIKKKDFKDSFTGNTNYPRVIIFGADQSPAISKNVLWTRFLNQDTAVAMGAEKYAIKYNLPVVYANLSSPRKGYFNLHFSLLTDTPMLTSEGEITKLHLRKLEEQIINEPGSWLWSHRRWKKKRQEA